MPSDHVPIDALLSDPPGLWSKETGLLVQKLRMFTPSRWSAGATALGSRADVVRHLAQWCADLAARTEGSPGRTLPILHPDLLLADQLAITADDLLRSRPAPSTLIDAAAHLLLHRWHLLGDEPPSSLGGAQMLERGRMVCQLA